MSDPKDHAKDDTKRNQLASHGSLHPHPDDVTDPLFDTDPFFDRRDAVQVKYEMLRSVSVEGRPVSQAAAHHGFSRPTFYQARAAFGRSGLRGLLPARKGPRRRHKLSKDVLDFVRAQLDAEGSLTMAVLSERVRERFGVRVHPRSIKRALDRRAKKNGSSGESVGAQRDCAHGAGACHGALSSRSIAARLEGEPRARRLLRVTSVVS